MPIANPTYSANTLVATRRQKDYLEISIQATPGDTVVSWLRVPLLSELGAYTPQTNDASLPLYVDASGNVNTLQASSPNGGTLDFATAADASNAVFTAILKAANAGTQCLYRIHVDSQGITTQGQCTLKDRGPQGAGTDIPSWGFTILAFGANHFNSTTYAQIV